MTFLAAAIASGSNSSTLNDVEPGVLGFLVVVGMGIILYFLLRSMNKQFKKLGPPPEEETDAESAAGEAGELQGNVQTGNAKQDENAQGTAKRK